MELVDPDDFPALYRSADATSLRGQKRFLVALRVRIGGLLLAAAGGVISLSVDSVDLGGLLALCGFLAALGAESYSAVTRPDRTWYEGRAAAESVKTLAWRFAVRGESFEGLADQDVERQFVEELSGILQDLSHLRLDSSGEHMRQITPAMRSLRQASFETRRAAYLDGRIGDQQAWYSRKSTWNEQRGHRWMVAVLVIELCGVIVGGARAFGSLEVDMLGVLAATAAAIVAWIQAKQYQTLATAYGVTAQELASVASEGDILDRQSDWARFVGEAEEAISREHTLWRASRGIRIRPPVRGS